MNVENMREMARYMRELPPEQIRMTTWGCNAECGTVACLAGHTVLHLGTDADKYQFWRYVNCKMRLTFDGIMDVTRHIQCAAQRILGLSDRESRMLFLDAGPLTPWDELGVYFDEATPEEVAGVVEYMIRREEGR